MVMKEDKVFSYIFYDILEEVLQLSENPSQFADYLTQQIRELIGAKTIVIAINDELNVPKIYSVFPKRRTEWANQDVVIHLAQVCNEFDKIKYLNNSQTDETGNILCTLEIEKALIIPLFVGNSKVGSILLLDMMDLFGIDPIVELLTRLSGIFALVIRNSLVYNDLEKLVKLRTAELQLQNQKLIEREQELIAANEEFEKLNNELSKNIKKTEEINRELEKAKEKAKESDRLKTAFLQNMSHEIRTPMNAILGFSNLMASNYNKKEKLEQFSKIINQRGNDLLDIIEDILDISKIESGQNKANIVECNLNELFSELDLFFRDYKSRTHKKHIELLLNQTIDEDISIIKTDRTKLKQILINLITNAFKYTDSGKIESGFKLANNQLQFYVADTGIGIPADKFDYIFERFSQLKQPTVQNIGGTGLGLSIVKGLVELLGGKVWLESEPNTGTTFYFTIDYIKSGLARNTKTSMPDNSGKLILDKTILIVEDDIYNALYLQEVLEESVSNIFTVGSGDEAINFIQDQLVDIILMDVRLPDITGYEATKIILQSNPKIKIIAQTAYAAYDERHKAINAGCVDYISKPTQKDELLNLLRKYI